MEQYILWVVTILALDAVGKILTLATGKGLNRTPGVLAFDTIVTIVFVVWGIVAVSGA